ncbi:MAG: rhamnulokinase [Bacteroidales bacterium]|nr:rhamnulokinase [Bacteroidales bacterium]
MELSKKHRFLAFDCGATSGRAILGTFADGNFTMEEVYRFPNQTLEIGGKYYWNVYGIYEHMLKCLTELGQRHIPIDSIGIDTWGVDFGCIGHDGTLLGLPRAYRDPYTDGVPEQFFKKVSREELYALTGIQTMNFNSIFQMFAQAEEGSVAYQHAKRILFMPDLLSYFLTRGKVCEYTIASTSGLMNQKTQQLETSLLQAVGLNQDQFPDRVQPGETVGKLRHNIAKETGLGEVPVVAVAGHDTASAIVAVPAKDEHFAYLSSGTWSLMGIEVNAPIINEQSARLNFTNEGGIEGTTRFLKNITGMWLVEQCRKKWQAQGKDYTYAQMTEMAESAKAYIGRINPDDPRFANPADMETEIRNALFDKSFAAPKNDAEMLSCIYHSLAERYKEVLDMLQEMAPFKIEKLHIIGGGSANALLNQWTADAIGMPVIAGPTEATALGNLMVQAKAAGLVADRWEMRNIIAQNFETKIFNPAP